MFTLAETPLDGQTPLPLDEAVDRSIEGARAAASQASGAPTTATQVSRTTGNFEGVETRRVVWDVTTGNDKATFTAAMFYRNNVVVQAVAVSNKGADSASVDRFLSSLRTRSG
jgi:hypothetical protein